MDYLSQIRSFWEGMLHPITLTNEVKTSLPSQAVTMIEEVGLPADPRLVKGPDLQVSFATGQEEIVPIAFQEAPYIRIGDRMWGVVGLGKMHKGGDIGVKVPTGEVYFLYPNFPPEFVNSTMLQLLTFAMLDIKYTEYMRKGYEALDASFSQEKAMEFHKERLRRVEAMQEHFSAMDHLAMTDTEDYFWRNVIWYRLSWLYELTS
jgi:hypothetical protein